MKNVVLCGSMKVKKEILQVGEQLKDLGFKVLYPEECINNLPKSIASRTHFERIINPTNEFVLIVNATKNHIDNYIGPNSLCEIAFAFYFKKKIYLLNDIYKPYKDELEAWGVVPLHGNLNHLK